MSKLSATQNVIRNKFKKIHADRLEHEHDVEQTLKPIKADTSSSSTATKITKESPRSQLCLNKSFSNHSTETRLIKVNNDPNALCDELRKLMLLSSSSHTDNTHAINAILRELRDLDILV